MRFRLSCQSFPSVANILSPLPPFVSSGYVWQACPKKGGGTSDELKVFPQVVESGPFSEFGEISRQDSLHVLWVSGNDDTAGSTEFYLEGVGGGGRRLAELGAVQFQQRAISVSHCCATKESHRCHSLGDGSLNCRVGVDKKKTCEGIASYTKGPDATHSPDFGIFPRPCNEETQHGEGNTP